MVPSILNFSTVLEETSSREDRIGQDIADSCFFCILLDADPSHLDHIACRR